MGLEARCTVRMDGRSWEAKVQLEGEEIVVRGDRRLKIPFRSISALSAVGGRLRVASAAGTATFDLGDAAGKWLERIRSPKGLLDKLGIKPGAAVSVLAVDDPTFRRDLAARVGTFADGRAAKGSDVVVVGMSGAKDLGRLDALRRAIAPGGAIWVVWPKGRKEFREDDVRAYALGHGLVDVKVVKFSETHAGLKLVIPVAMR